MSLTVAEPTAATVQVKKYTAAFSMLTALFFIWGFITSLNDILLPYLKQSFVLSYFEATLVQFSFFGAYFIGSAAYFLVSIYYGDLISRIGYKNCIVAGLLTAAVACCMFYPAAHYKVYAFFLAALFCLGIGFTLLQIAANPYVIILGPEKAASSRLNLAQAINSLGTTISPLVGGWLLFDTLKSSTPPGPVVIQQLYLAFAAIFFLLAMIFKFIKLPAFAVETVHVKGAGALRHSNLVLGIAAIFTYVGAEVCIGSFMIAFLKLPRMGSLPETTGSKYVAMYWGGLMAGRFIGAISLSSIEKPARYLLMTLLPILLFIVLLWSLSLDDAFYAGFFLLSNLLGFFAGRNLPARTLGIFSVMLIILLLVAITNAGALAKWALVATGLFNSICWSNIFSLALKFLAEYTSQGSSLLIMAILGAAVVPVVQGFFADRIGLQYSFFIPVLCYVYLAWYGLHQHRSFEMTTRTTHLQ